MSAITVVSPLADDGDGRSGLTGTSHSAHLRLLPTQQLHAVQGARQQTLPLRWEVAPGIPAVPTLPRHLRVVGSTALTEPQQDDEPSPPACKTRLAYQSDGPWAQSIGTMVIEESFVVFPETRSPVRPFPGYNLYVGSSVNSMEIGCSFIVFPDGGPFPPRN